MKKHYYLEDFLLTFHTDADVQSDKDGILEYLSDVAGKATIEFALKEGREVLSMDPFPWEWVAETTNRLVYDKEKDEWVEDPKLYKAWVCHLLDLLEQEARKQGKL